VTDISTGIDNAIVQTRRRYGQRAVFVAVIGILVVAASVLFIFPQQQQKSDVTSAAQHYLYLNSPKTRAAAEDVASRHSCITRSGLSLHSVPMHVLAGGDSLRFVCPQAQSQPMFYH
jgi:hypothetical protein